MNLLFLLAAVLLLVLGVMHSMLGERLIFRVIFSLPDLPTLLGSRPFMQQTLRFTWHTTTALLVVIATILVFLAFTPQSALRDAMAGTISAGLFVCALLSGVIARRRHFSWLVFLACSGLVWVGI